MATPTATLDDLVLPSPIAMKSVMDLYPFFHALEQPRLRANASEDTVVAVTERRLEKDFLEPIPA